MANEIDNETIKETKKAIKDAQKNLEEISKDEHERYLAELREKYVRDQVAIQEYGYYKGIEEGIEQGQLAEKLQIAKKLLEKGTKIEDIIEITGLTKEELEKL